MMPLGDTGLITQLDGARGSDTAPYIAYVNDGPTELALQEGLGDLGDALEIHRGGIKAALVALQRINSPRVLIVDVGGEEAPLAALEALSDVVEPHVCVLVVGDLSGLDFYRVVTRGIGAAEYLAKPLSRDIVARHFVPLLHGRAPADETALGGRMVTVTGVRGGVGATTVAVNLAWQFGVTNRRHTVLLDPDTYLGTASFLLNVEPGAGLSTALKTPERIDTLLAERAAVPVDDRLHVLASQEPLGAMMEHMPEAADRLLAALRRRYNFIVADVPFRPLPLYRDLLNLAHRRVLVLEPTLASVRDALRLLDLPRRPGDNEPILLVLNRLGRPGGLTRTQIEDALHRKIDIAIPDLPKAIESAATFGKPAATTNGPFRNAIVELSRTVAFSRLVDSKEFWAKPAGRKRGLFGRAARGKA
jgi:pilus assembly protein CpaE